MHEGEHADPLSSLWTRGFRADLTSDFGMPQEGAPQLWARGTPQFLGPDFALS